MNFIKHWLKTFLPQVLVNFYIKLKSKIFHRAKKSKLKSIYKKKGVITVGFEISATHFNQTFSIIQAISKSRYFKPVIIVSFGGNHSVESSTLLLEKLQSKFGDIECISEFGSNNIFKIVELCDFVFYSCPYLYSKKYYHNLPACYVPYGAFLVPGGDPFLSMITNIKILTDALFVFIENADVMKLYQDYQKVEVSNKIVLGYPKFDLIHAIEIKPRKRKKIFLCPHHSINDNCSFSSSMFLKYSDFFLQLPEKYPQIDFVFRPHPILKVRLSKELWGVEKTNLYFEKMCSFQNVEYQPTGDYYDDFVNSDGMILDCCSFLPEYMITGHPSIYMLPDSDIDNNAVFSPVGKKVLKHVYHAFEKKDITHFIEHVIMDGEDTMKESRMAFAKEYLMINYPNVGEKIVEFLERELIKK